MTIYHTNNPSRFGGCYATWDPLASQAQVSTATTSAGVRKGHKANFRVRRADFTDQRNYEMALKAALAGANLAIIERDEQIPPQKKQKKIVPEPRNDTAIEISPESFLALQKASEMDELELIQVFISAIESEYDEG